jgi:hypothetical protein
MLLRRSIIRVAVAVVAMPLLASPAAGQRRVKQLVQELLQAETVFPQERGEIQITVAPRVTHWGAARLTSSTLQLELGLTDVWQVEVEAEAYSLRRPGLSAGSGLGELAIGARRSWLAIGGSSLHIAAGADLAFAPESFDDTEREMSIEPGFAIARDFDNGLELFGSLGAELPWRAIGDVDVTTHAGFLFPIGALRLTSELGWRSGDKPGDDRRVLALTSGIVAVLAPAFELAIGVPMRLQGDPGCTLLAKLTVEF